MKTVFLRVLGAEDKAAELLEAVRQPERAARDRMRFEVAPGSFAGLPRSPFAYWVSNKVMGLFGTLPMLESAGRTVCFGLSTKNDFRFVRVWWELLPDLKPLAWVPFAKGGSHSPSYADLQLSVRWAGDGAELKAFAEKRLGEMSSSQSWSRWIVGRGFYFRPGLTWPLRTSRGLSLRPMPANCIFGSKGPGAFASDNDTRELLALLAIGNSSAFSACLELQLAAADAAARSYEVGLLQTTPVPSLTDPDREALARLARRAWSLKRSLDTCIEASHAFTLPALLQVSRAEPTVPAEACSEYVVTVEGELVAIQAEIDERCFTLYGIDDADRRAITEGFGIRKSEEVSSDARGAEEDDDGEDSEEADLAADAASFSAELVSWAVGVAFGRFDVRLATGARPMPPEPEPFDALPACSPGMLSGEDGLPLSRPPVGYPLAFPESGILVDDPGHAQDLTAAVRAVFEVVFGDDADRWWNDVAALLDPKGHDLRVWVAGSYFEHHLKRHSKSRRKAPILWQLGTPSGRYSVWLYAHRLTRDSFFQLQNEVVGPKLTHEERQLTSLMQNAGGDPSASERREIASQEAVVAELRGMLDEVKRVAPLWNPNLDDGVVLTMAPLWRLVPQHKPWQRELRAKWDELAAGKYDWAHIAMHLWPERVVPKCATDRSLAIAHGLEDVFWIEGADGKWKARTTPERPVDELLRERSSPAVKAALKGLLDSQTASGREGGRGRRAPPAAAIWRGTS